MGRILRWIGIICFAVILGVNAVDSAAGGQNISSPPADRKSRAMEFASDGCTLFAAEDRDITRFDVCANRPLPKFNLTPLPDSEGAQQLRILSDGSVLAANYSVIVRYDPNGLLAQTYDDADRDCWSGLAVEADNSAFWASDSCSATLTRFEINNQAAANEQGRMFGGGTEFTATRLQVNHGVDVHCTTATQPNYVQVTWAVGNVFFMQNMTSVSCTGSPFSTVSGTGTGTINGEAGATVEWTFTDAGDPGVFNDSARILIRNATGQVVIDVSGKIWAGNHIARN